jgi:hypothetical protein
MVTVLRNGETAHSSCCEESTIWSPKVTYNKENKKQKEKKENCIKIKFLVLIPRQQ